MCTRTYLQDYLESINKIPEESKHLLREIEDLDRKCYYLSKKINSEKSISTGKSKLRTSNKTKEYFDQLISLCDKKISKASEIYDAVDSQIQRLDMDLAQFDKQMRDNKECFVGDLASASSRKRSISKRDSQKFSVTAKAPPPISSIAIALDEPQQAIDMPIDPNEPTYCICNDFSYGEMIGCDNPTCPIEWFHFACVGLKKKPNGDWFCPECSRKNKKR